MLWYKGWLETRYRLLFMLVSMSAFVIFLASAGSNAPYRGIRPVVGFISVSVPAFVVMICAMLGGAGIATQSAFQATKGLHGSTLFTLSLPVSRLRLLAVRASIGWLEAIGVIAVLCCGMWLVFPAFRAIGTPVEMLEYAGTLIA